MTSKGVDALAAAYSNAPPDGLALYLGAGVNFPVSSDLAKQSLFPTYGWIDLLRELHARNDNPSKIPFDTILRRHDDDWSDLASRIQEDYEPGRFWANIEAVIYSNIPRGDRYGRLSKRFLDQAPSLRAAICFSSQIATRTHTSWTFERNPKLGMVITPNYDFFYGAGWTRFQAFRRTWKVHTPGSSQTVSGSQRPIYYIHGYLPYKPGPRADVVLTRRSYEEAYSPDGFARRTLVHALENCRLIFAGTSFTDRPLCQLLRRLRHTGKHFAIVRCDLVPKAEELGVTPIVVDDYGKISDVLKTVYCRATPAAVYEKFGLGTPEEYWERLEAGPSRGRPRPSRRLSVMPARGTSDPLL